MGRVTVGEGESWQSVAERTTGPGTHPAIIEANGGHPDVAPESGSDVEVPGYGDEATEPENTQSEPDEPQVPAGEPTGDVDGDADEEADPE